MSIVISRLLMEQFLHHNHSRASVNFFCASFSSLSFSKSFLFTSMICSFLLLDRLVLLPEHVVLLSDLLFLQPDGLVLLQEHVVQRRFVLRVSHSANPAKYVNAIKYQEQLIENLIYSKRLSYTPGT